MQHRTLEPLLGYSCTLCKTFESFADSYFDDKEPSDQGFCSNAKSEYYGNEGAGADVCCGVFERRR